MSYPVRAVSLPADLDGQLNGLLDPELLVVCGFPGRPTGRLHTQAARSWWALAVEVQDRFGQLLTVTSTPDGYRSYMVQEVTFRARYTTDPLPGRPTKRWNGQTWYQKPGTAMAATPGSSNHGWGLALDVCYWIDGQIVSITSDKDVFKWMTAKTPAGITNVETYGFSWEAQSEPWHLRLFTGDHTPKAVLDHENPAPPEPSPEPPTPPIEDPIMLLVQHSSGALFAVTDGFTSKKSIPTTADWDTLVNLGTYPVVLRGGFTDPFIDSIPPV